jgi:hypothetical protein
MNGRAHRHARIVASAGSHGSTTPRLPRSGPRPVPAWWLAPALVLVLGCKDRAPEPPSATAVRKALQDRMCACTTRSCAKLVSGELADVSRATASKEAALAAADTASLAALDAAIAACATKIMHANTRPDEMIRDAFDHPPTDRAYVVEVTVRDVQSDGTLDLDTGEAVVRFNLIPESGSSGPPQPAGCPMWRWKDGERTQGETSCLGFDPIAPPRCTIAQLWQRAIALPTPADALATISRGSVQANAAELEAMVAQGDGATTRRWLFQALDHARAVVAATTILDDCDPAKP